MRRAGRAIAVVTCMALLATACVGSVSREEFEEEIQSRGGGLSQDLAVEAVDAMADELGQPALFETITVFPEYVVMRVSSPDFPEELDSYTYRGGDLSDPEPVNQGAVPDIQLPDIQLPEGLDLPPEVQEQLDQLQQAPAGAATAATLFTAEEVALDRLDEMVDRALDTSGLREPYATNVSIRRQAGAPIRIGVSVTNDRRDTTVQFGPQGRPVEVG